MQQRKLQDIYRTADAALASKEGRAAYGKEFFRAEIDRVEARPVASTMTDREIDLLVTRRGREARLSARVCGPWEGVRSAETGIGRRYGAYRRQCLCRVKFQYRSASDAVHDSRSSCRAKLVLAQSVKRSRAPSVARAR